MCTQLFSWNRKNRTVLEGYSCALIKFPDLLLLQCLKGKKVKCFATQNEFMRKRMFAILELDESYLLFSL